MIVWPGVGARSKAPRCRPAPGYRLGPCAKGEDTENGDPGWRRPLLRSRERIPVARCAPPQRHSSAAVRSRLTRFLPRRPVPQRTAQHPPAARASRGGGAPKRPPQQPRGGVGVERQLPKNLVLAVNYLHSRGWHNLRSRALTPTGSIAAPDVTAIYLYESSGIFKQDQLVTTVTARVNPKISFNGSYTFGEANSNTDGAGTFPADSYNLRPEYGRAGFDVRHRVQFSGAFAFRWGLRLSPMLVATSTRPFNMTVGRDLNGDTIFTDRPAVATDLSRPSVVRTAFGAFDLAPTPGQTIIPRNYGVGPGLVSLNLRLAKTFKLGKEAKGKRDPMELTFTALSRNLLNHPNLALPDGNLSSPYFGESTALVTGGGGNSASGNRRIEFQCRLAF